MSNPFEPRKETRLPEIVSGGFGSVLVRHALSLSLVLVAFLAIAAFLAAERVLINPTISSSGTLEPAQISRVSSLESGVVSEVLVGTGELVQRGQVLVALDPSLARSSVSEIEAELRALAADSERLEVELPILEQRTAAVVATARAHVMGAQGRLRMSMADFGLFGDPDSTLDSIGLKPIVMLGAPAAELSAAKTGLSVAIADSSLAAVRKLDRLKLHEAAERTRVKLQLAKLRLQRHSIVSPIAGVVLTARPDQLVGTSISAGSALVELAASNKWSVVIGLSERDAQRVVIGDRAAIELPNVSAISRFRTQGRVTLVSWGPPAGGARAASAPTGFWALVNFDHEDATATSSILLRRGLSVRVTVIPKKVGLREMILERFRALLI
jgi:multidrug resistance efflux pump